MRLPSCPMWSRLEIGRIPGEFDKWQTRLIISSLYHDLIRAYRRRGFKPLTGSKGDVIVLVNPIPTHPHASYQLPVFVQRDAASKDLSAILHARDILALHFG